MHEIENKNNSLDSMRENKTKRLKNWKQRVRNCDANVFTHLCPDAQFLN